MRRALVMVAHGSLEHGASGEPARRHAAAIAARGLFDQVLIGFWKERPSLRDLRYLIDADEAVIVPLFMAEGYFTGRVVPRELGLTGAVTEGLGGRRLYTPPVGTDPRMREVILRLAEDALAPTGVPPGEATLVVVGHGTVQNPRSKEAVLAHVERLEAAGRFAEVRAAYLEEPPYVQDIPADAGTGEVVVVPLFVADGFHTDEDIPRALGLIAGPAGWQVPSESGGKRIYYTTAVGNSPVMVEVILARAEAALGEPLAPLAHPPRRPRWAECFLAWLREQPSSVPWLEVVVERSGPGYRLRHRDDPAPNRVVDDLFALGRWTADGVYRPLPTALDLSRGWTTPPLDDDRLLAALEALYPASVAIWAAEREGRLDVASWREVAARQTGLLGLVKRLSDSDLRAAAAVCCNDRCALRREWELGPDETLDPPARPAAVACAEPCSWFLSFAREVIGWRRGETAAESALLQAFAARQEVERGPLPTAGRGPAADDQPNRPEH